MLAAATQLATFGLQPQAASAAAPRPPAAGFSRRALLASVATGLSAGLAPPAHAEATKECLSGCFKECNALTKSGSYCSEQCDAYCSEEGATGTDDVLRSDPSLAVSLKDCSGYKTDQAKAWCASKNEKTRQLARGPEDKNLGIFGDSGVTYSKGLEDFFATAFGATQQSKPRDKADIDSFTSELGKAAAGALSGSE